MQLVNWIKRNSSLSWDALFNPRTGAVRIISDGQGNVTIVEWNDALLAPLAKPSAGQLVNIAAMPEADPVETLIAYASTTQSAVLAAGITVNVAPPGQPTVNVLCDGSVETRADLAGLFNWGTENPTATQAWLDNNGVVTLLTGTECVALATAIRTWVSNTYQTLTTTLAGIKSNAILTRSQIDALVWPTS